MAEGDLLTLEFAQRVNDLMREFSPRTDDLPDAQVIARGLSKRSIGLVDIAKQRAWIDERVHSGVLFRLRAAELRANAAAYRLPSPAVWANLSRMVYG